MRLCFCYFDEICYKRRQQTHIQYFYEKKEETKKYISEKKYDKKNLNGSAYTIYVNKQTIIIIMKIQSGMSVYIRSAIHLTT